MVESLCRVSIISLASIYLGLVLWFILGEACSPNFERPQQGKVYGAWAGSMTTTAYEPKFHVLSKYATH